MIIDQVSVLNRFDLDQVCHQPSSPFRYRIWASKCISLYEKEKEDEGKKSKLVKSTTTKDLQTVQVSSYSDIQKNCFFLHKLWICLSITHSNSRPQHNDFVCLISLKLTSMIFIVLIRYSWYHSNNISRATFIEEHVCCLFTSDVCLPVAFPILRQWLRSYEKFVPYFITDSVFSIIISLYLEYLFIYSSNKISILYRYQLLRPTNAPSLTRISWKQIRQKNLRSSSV